MLALSTKAIRVVVIEGQTLFAKALCQVLSADEDLKVVADARSIADVRLTALQPDLIIIDLDGHPLEITDAVRQCRDQVPQAAVCVLSIHLEPEVMQRCLAAGADGYVAKDVMPADLVRAAKSVASGISYVDPRIAGGLLRRRNLLNGRPDLNELSARETEIIRLIAGGLSNKDISTRLKLSEKTVKNHISRIFSKLNITARTQADPCDKDRYGLGPSAASTSRFVPSRLLAIALCS